MLYEMFVLSTPDLTRSSYTKTSEYSKLIMRVHGGIITIASTIATQDINKNEEWVHSVRKGAPFTIWLSFHESKIILKTKM